MLVVLSRFDYILKAMGTRRGRGKLGNSMIRGAFYEAPLAAFSRCCWHGREMSGPVWHIHRDVLEVVEDPSASLLENSTASGS